MKESSKKQKRKQSKPRSVSPAQPQLTPQPAHNRVKEVEDFGSLSESDQLNRLFRTLPNSEFPQPDTGQAFALLPQPFKQKKTK